MTRRTLIGLLMSLALLCAACTPWGEREPAQAPAQIPVDTPETLANLLLPDFQMLKMTARPYNHGWYITLWVENVGGNQGLLEKSVRFGEPPRRRAGMTIKLDIMECRSSRDMGQDDFECINPRPWSRTPGIVLPLAGDTSRRIVYIDHLHNPWQIYAMVLPTRHEDGEPVLEKDSPERMNNQALLMIVYDPERSSYDPLTRTWTWPNDEDTLPL